LGNPGKRELLKKNCHGKKIKSPFKTRRKYGGKYNLDGRGRSKKSITGLPSGGESWKKILKRKARGKVQHTGPWSLRNGLSLQREAVLARGGRNVEKYLNRRRP